MSRDNWLFVFQSAPSEAGLTADGLDFCLVAASFGVNSKLLFIGDGLQHLINTEASAKRGMLLPSFTKTFKALADFEIEQCYILEQGLGHLDLIERDLSIEVEIIETSEIRLLLDSASKVFHF